MAHMSFVYLFCILLLSNLFNHLGTAERFVGSYVSASPVVQNYLNIFPLLICE